MVNYIQNALRKVFRYLGEDKPGWFVKNFKELRAQEENSTPRFTLSESDFYYCLNDRTSVTPFDRHYIYHPAWAAQIIAKTRPQKHIDISSTLHFSTILSAFVNTEFYDYRPAEVVLDNFHSSKADLTHLFFADESISSLSCMHTVEHIGLGRYGDPIDYDGDLKAMKELARVLAKEGTLLFVSPVGKEDKIMFNAHRVYTARSVKNSFEKVGLKLHEFSYIPQKEGPMRVESIDTFTTNDSYGCGCFWFTK